MRTLPVRVELQQRPADVRRHHRDVARGEIGHARRRAFVGNVGDVRHADQLLEQLAGQIGHGAGAGRAVGQLGRIGPGVVDELLERVGGHRLVHHDAGRRDRHDVDRLEVLHRIVGRLVGDRRNDDLGAGVAEQQRLAVGRRARHFGRADHAAAAAFVLGHDGAELGLHPLGPKPADHVGRAAGRERHDQLDRPLRKGGEGGKRQGRGRKRGQSGAGENRVDSLLILGWDCVCHAPYANRAVRKTTATRRSRP